MRISQLHAHLEGLRRFNDAYIEYLEEQDRNARARLRAEVFEAIPAADEALDLVGQVEIYPPPMLAGSMPIRRGLRNLAFEHESEFTTPGHPSTAKFILDSVLQGKGNLEHLIEIERRKMRNPLYWIDRSLRALLGIPAYLISLIVGVPLRRLESGPWGPPLRVVAVAADIAGVWGVGRVLGWW